MHHNRSVTVLILCDINQVLSVLQSLHLAIATLLGMKWNLTIIYIYMHAHTHTHTHIHKNYIILKFGSIAVLLQPKLRSEM